MAAGSDDDFADVCTPGETAVTVVALASAGENVTNQYIKFATVQLRKFSINTLH